MDSAGCRPAAATTEPRQRYSPRPTQWHTRSRSVAYRLHLVRRADGRFDYVEPNRSHVPFNPVWSSPGLDQSHTPVGKIFLSRAISSVANETLYSARSTGFSWHLMMSAVTGAPATSR